MSLNVNHNRFPSLYLSLPVCARLLIAAFFFSPSRRRAGRDGFIAMNLHQIINRLFVQTIICALSAMHEGRPRWQRLCCSSIFLKLPYDYMVIHFASSRGCAIKWKWIVRNQEMKLNAEAWPAIGCRIHDYGKNQLNLRSRVNRNKNRILMKS